MAPRQLLFMAAAGVRVSFVHFSEWAGHDTRLIFCHLVGNVLLLSIIVCRNSVSPIKSINDRTKLVGRSVVSISSYRKLRSFGGHRARLVVVWKKMSFQG